MLNNVTEEQKAILKMIDQMTSMHDTNKSVVRAMDFLKECIENRMERTE
jgi:hypothetical protein